MSTLATTPRASLAARVLASLMLLIAACLFAGAYGASHNQISSTVSPEYFTRFKFVQFGIGPALPLRIGAAVVGWKAAWWMGLLIGVPVVGFGLRHRTIQAQVRGTLIAFAMVTATALTVGVLALLHGFAEIGPSSLPGFWYPEGVIDRVAFARAGHMHNFSYIGGFVGIITGSLTQRWLSRAGAPSTSESASAPGETRGS